VINVVPGLTTHTMIVCVQKKERAIPIQAVLQKMGVKTIVCQGLSDSLKEIQTHMPHLIYSEALLGDGNAGLLYDKMKADPLLSHAPIVVQVIQKSKEELIPLKGRSFAGLLAGPFNPTSFAAKVKEVLKSHGSGSPYSADMNRYNVSTDCLLSLNGMILGSSGGQIVVKSNIEVDSGASFVLVPTNRTMAPVLLKMGTNLKNGEDILNLFPANRAKGKGMEWVLKLPDFDVATGGAGAASKPKAKRKVLFQDPSAERANQMKQILSGYDIELVHVANLQQAASSLKREPENFGCVFLYELMSGGSGAVWTEALNSVEASKRPNVVIGTSSMNAKSTATTRYIKRPFGMGVFIQTLEAAFERGASIAKSAEVAAANIEAEYQAPVKLIALDETGGVVQLKFPVVASSVIALKHESLKEIWSSDSKVKIAASGVFPDRPDTWQARFESVAVGTSKAKYMQKVYQILKPLQKPADEISEVAADDAAGQLPVDQAS